LAALLHEGWNSVHIAARSNILSRRIDGRVMAAMVDDDRKRIRKG